MPNGMDYAALAKRIDVHLLDPLWSEEQVRAACAEAAELDARAVFVRPSDLDLARSWVDGERVRLGSVCAYPHGNTTTGVKQYEIRDLIRRGARDIEVVVNVSKVISRQFQYVEIELMQMLKSCEENGAQLTVVFQAGHCNEEQTLVLCKMTKRTGITLASTGDAFRAGQVELMLRKLAPYAEVKIAGDGLSLEEVLQYQQMGVVRFGLSQPLALLTAWKQQLEAEAGEEVPPAPVIS